MTKERAVLAGGCFWGVQDLFRRYDGVLSTRVGYTGGNTPNATYRNHGTHTEAVEIIFDPARISYRQILEFFFAIAKEMTSDRAIGLRFSTLQTSSVALPRTPSRMSTNPGSGRAKS
jgi:peptide-methionine (S)-S-oxide reductase